MALEARIHKKGIDRIVLEKYPEGVYVFIFEHPESLHPYRDYLQDTWEMAKRCSQDEAGVCEIEWVEIPDPGLL